MTSDPALSLTDVIMAVFRDDPAVTRLVGYRVFEDQIDNSPSQHGKIILGDTRSRGWKSATSTGQDHEITLHIHGLGPTVRKISSAIVALLHDADLEIPGHTLTDLQFQWSETRFLKESKSYHCLMAFKGITVADCCAEVATHGGP